MPTPGKPSLHHVMVSKLTSCRIIKDYYIAEPDPTRRPRVFGMTASPVDAREDVVEAAK